MEHKVSRKVLYGRSHAEGLMEGSSNIINSSGSLLALITTHLCTIIENGSGATVHTYFQGVEIVVIAVTAHASPVTPLQWLVLSPLCVFEYFLTAA